jgi:hypothetical protein
MLRTRNLNPVPIETEDAAEAKIPRLSQSRRNGRNLLLGYCPDANRPLTRKVHEWLLGQRLGRRAVFRRNHLRRWRECRKRSRFRRQVVWWFIKGDVYEENEQRQKSEKKQTNHNVLPFR